MPNETLAPSSVALQLSVFDGISSSETAEAVDGGTALDTVVYTPVPGVTILACQTSDPGCANPVVAAQTTDDAGVVSLGLAGNFTGFFHGSGPTITSFSFFPGQWLSGVQAATYSVETLSPGDLAGLNTILGGTLDLDAGAALGELFLSVYDCADHTLAGVAFSLSQTGGETLPFYFISGSLIGGLPSTSATQTDQLGIGGAVNVPAGPVTAQATVVATGEVIGSVSVVIRAGEITNGWIRPRVH